MITACFNTACSGGDLIVGIGTSGGDDSGGKSLAATACNHSPAPRAALTGSCQDNWCWENPLPSGAAVHLGSAADGANQAQDLFVWTAHELRSLQNGQWQSHPLPANVGEIGSVFARNRKDIWLSPHRSVDPLPHTLFHFDGTSWEAPESSPEFEVTQLQAAPVDGTLWGTSRSQMVTFDGAHWSPVEEPSPAQDTEFTVDFRPVSAHELWRLRSDGALQHYLDGAWTSYPIPGVQSNVGSSALTLQVMDDGSVWVAGFGEELIPNIRHNLFIEADNRAKGFLLRFDGKNFSNVELPPIGGVQALFGTPSDLWLASTDGETVHYDGKQFSPVTFSPHDTAAFAKRGDELWALAVDWGNRGTGAIARWDGQDWATGAPVPTVETITALWGSALDDVWAVGTNGLRLHFDGVAWSDTRATSDTDDYGAVWGTSKHSVYTVTQAGLQHFDGQGWTLVAEAPSSWTLMKGNHTISGLADDDLWIAAGGVFHYDGVRLKKVTTPLTDGPSEDGLTTLDSTTSVISFSNRDVWIANGPDLAHFDGTSWTVPGVPGEKLWGRSSTDLWTVFENSFPNHGKGVAHFDGTTWTKYAASSDVLAPNAAYADDGSSLGGCDNYFWITKENQLNVFDGTTWSSSYLDGPYDAAIWGQAPDTLVAGGLRGGIMRRTP